MLAGGRRSWLLASMLWIALAPFIALGACEPQPPPMERRPPPKAETVVALPPSVSAAVPPLASAAAAFERSVRATRLKVPTQRSHRPRLAFGRGVIGQLTNDELRVFDASTFERVASYPIRQPSALITLADGAFLVLAADRAQRFEPNSRKLEPMARLPMPWADVYGDPQQRDRVWLFDGGGSAPAGPPRLHAFRLVAGAAGVQLPEQSIELETPRGGVFGPTREGVWIYLTPTRVERLSPGGSRLPGFPFGGDRMPAWVLPARRLDQALLLDESGGVSRALLVDRHAQLGLPVRLARSPYSAAVGDQGRLLAATVVTGSGPRFELVLLDADLRGLARVELPSDELTLDEDWVKVVTANQEVAVSATKPLVAVGGPSRIALFDRAGRRLFSIPSQ